MAIGEHDRISGVEACRRLAETYVSAGGNATVKLYPGAQSGFDGHPAVVRLYQDPSMETFVDCTCSSSRMADPRTSARRLLKATRRA